MACCSPACGRPTCTGGQLHREVEARQAADILKEAAIKAQLELQDGQEEMRGQVAAAHGQAREAPVTAPLVSTTSQCASPESGPHPRSRQAREAAAELHRLQLMETSLRASPGADTPRDRAVHDAVDAARKASTEAEAAAAEAEAELAEEEVVAGKSGAQLLAELPREIQRSNKALRLLCARLKKIERPEATLLYADVMSTRAKLVHATNQWVAPASE